MIPALVRRVRVAPELVLMLATALWGLAFLITRVAMRDVAPLPFTALRFAVAAVVVAVLTRPALARTSGVEVRGAGALGLAMVAGYALQAAGLQTLGSGRVAFISALYVPLVPLLQMVVLRRAPGARVWLGAGLAAAGMMLMARHGEGAGWTAGRGEMFALGGAFAIAAEITLVGIFAPLADPRRLAVLQCAVVSVLALVLSVVAGEGLPAVGAWLGCGVGLGLMSAFLQLSTNWAMRSVPATRATLIFAMEPVWASVFGAMAGEAMGGAAYLGGALIVGALVVTAGGERGGELHQL